MRVGTVIISIKTFILLSRSYNNTRFYLVLFSGRFSICKRCVYIPQQYECVVKFISKKYINKENAYNEFKISSCLNHDNFIKTFQFIDFDDIYTAIVMQ